MLRTVSLCLCMHQDNVIDDNARMQIVGEERTYGSDQTDANKVQLFHGCALEVQSKQHLLDTNVFTDITTSMYL